MSNTRKRTVLGFQLIEEISEILTQTENESLVDIANKVLGGTVTIIDDDLFQVEEEE